MTSVLGLPHPIDIHSCRKPEPMPKQSLQAIIRVYNRSQRSYLASSTEKRAASCNKDKSRRNSIRPSIQDRALLLKYHAPHRYFCTCSSLHCQNFSALPPSRPASATSVRRNDTRPKGMTAHQSVHSHDTSRQDDLPHSFCFKPLTSGDRPAKNSVYAPLTAGYVMSSTTSWPSHPE